MADPRKKILLTTQDADDDDEDVDMDMPTGPETLSDELISQIITPSPYPQHNEGTSRFSNALSRVTQHPMSNAEAWQAVLTEVATCYRELPSVHAVDADTQAKLDWVESCYGNLLLHFPYAAQHAATLIGMLLSQSARVGEEGGPTLNAGLVETSKRARTCEAKVERLFAQLLIDEDGEPAICAWSVDLWLLYVRKAHRDASRKVPVGEPEEDRQKAIVQATKEAYQKAVEFAGGAHRNDELWKAYLTYMRATSSAQQPLILQLRPVYQQLVIHPMNGLDQLWQEYESLEREQDETLVQAFVNDLKPKYQHARSVFLDRRKRGIEEELQFGRLATPPVDEDDGRKEEIALLEKWKLRCSYERTNPERLTSTDLPLRLRMIFREMACMFMRHPESWHMWSAWELSQPGKQQKDLSISVLEMGQTHIPDSTFLVHAHALLLSDPSDILAVWESFLERSPNTLGFVLYQKLVRRFTGVDAARAVFARARRTLVESKCSQSVDSEKLQIADKKEGEKEPENEPEVKVDEVEDQKWVVTNRLDDSVGAVKREANTGRQHGGGTVTWHMYAAHAEMEHRLNLQPEVAGRVYELGLRKHASFLTKPPYVLRYAQLLLELRDTDNLRALLTRAVAACEVAKSQSALAAVWNMSLHFESLLSGLNQGSSLGDIEMRRHAALNGPGIEDVEKGGIRKDMDAGVGAQKSSIAEQLIRSEGYDVSSRIVNGLSRTIDMFRVVGLWGDTGFDSHVTTPDVDAEIPGGVSDRSLQRRLSRTNKRDSLNEGIQGSRGILGRQGAAAVASGIPPGSSMMLAIQQSPEWLRSLLLALPASHMRMALVAKPPPHYVEAALAHLRQGTLPAERPKDTSRKRGLGADDSDDDIENGTGGYAHQFRARQRVRQQTDDSMLLS